MNKGLSVGVPGAPASALENRMWGGVKMHHICVADMAGGAPGSSEHWELLSGLVSGGCWAVRGSE